MPQCRTCLQELDRDDTICPRCGTPRLEPWRFSVQERKIASVLFADIRQSLRLIRGRDPEEVSEIVDPIVDAFADGVRRHGGTVVQRRGDGLLGVFGAPVSHEDHASRACNAALAMLEWVCSLAEQARVRWFADIAVRIGIHSGEILSRSARDGATEGFDITGDTVYVAARMEQTAASGTIQISLATRRLAGDTIAVRSIGTRRIKGLSERVETFELLAPQPVSLPQPRLGGGAITPFVNRTVELATLAAALARAESGAGQAIAVSGEPGCGKSRLLQEATRCGRSADPIVLHAACNVDGSRTSYLPFQVLCRQALALDRSEADVPRAVRQMLGSAAEMSQSESARAGLAIAALIDSAAAQSAKWLAIGPGERRISVFKAIRALLAALCRMRPVVLIIEDLHWADNESLAVIECILDDLPAHLALLFNLRPGAAGSVVISHAKLDHLRLEPLAPAEARQLVVRLLGSSAASGELVELVNARAGGNPFFAEEIITDLAEQGVILGERFAYELRAAPLHHGVPMTVRAVLAARIDRLTLDEKGLLEAASVIGRVFDRDLLAAVLQQSEDVVEHLLSQLAEAQFVDPSGGDQYCFRHGLTHEATYLGMAQRRRRALHLAVLEALVVRPAPTLHEHVEALLHHAIQAQVWHAAAGFARAAGAKSLSLSANRQARIFLTQGLNALDHLPEGRERDELAADLRLDMREALFRLGMLPEVVSRLSEAEAIAERLGDRRRRGQIIINLSHILWLTGDYPAAAAAADRAIARGQEWQDHALGVRARFQVGLTELASGWFHAAAESMEYVIGAIQAAPDMLGSYGLDTALEALARSYAARAYTDLGDFAATELAVAESRRIAAQLNRPFSRLFADLAHSYAALHRGDAAAALESADAALVHCREAEASLMTPVALTLLGAARLNAGDAAQALEPLRSAVASAAAMKLRFNQPYRMAVLAEAELLTAGAAAALASARGAISLATRIGEPAGKALAFRTLGLVQARTGASERATRSYRRALALAQSLRMQPLLERCQREAATLGLAAVLVR
jgi:class 3 adenylate cyclase/tetratricopeptide (TPR) repeat protein